MLLESWIDLWDETWTRKINYPIIPFPGLHVGAMVVKAVYCCQGELDEVSPINVELKWADESSLSLEFIRSLLKQRGWERVED